MADDYTMADVLAGMTDTYGAGPYPEAEPAPQSWAEFVQRTHRMPALLQIPYKAAESVRGILSGDLQYQPGVRRADVTNVPAPTGPTQDSTWLGRLMGVPPVAWEPNDPYIEGAGDIAGLMVGSGPAGSGSVGSGAAYRQGFSERMAAGKEANARFADRPAYARAQAPEGAPNQPPLLAPGETRGDLVRALGAEPLEQSIGDIGRDAYREILANPPPQSIAAVGKQAYDDTLTGFTLGSGSKKAAPATLTLEQFNDLARGGRMRMAGEPGELKPSKAALDKAETAVDYGRLYGYSEADIARFYQERRGGHPLGYQEYARDFANAKVPPVAPKATTEMTPIGEQYVLPGAERKSTAEVAKQKAEEPLRPTVAQKPMDEGLFGDSAAQMELPGFKLGSGSRKASSAIAALKASQANEPTMADVLRGGAGGPTGIRAYHGSPYDFDRFDLSKVGTGQGAQSYGHGIYLAENPATAQHYREMLAGAQPDIENFRIGSMNLSPRNNFDYSRNATRSTLDNIHSSLAEDVLIDQGALLGSPDKQKFVLDRLDQKIADYKREWPEGVAPAMRLREQLSRPGAVSLKTGPMPGHMYEVNINAAPEHFLDWDKPLSAQPDIVAKLPMLRAAAEREAYDRAIAATNKPRADELWAMVKDPMQTPANFGFKRWEQFAGPQTSVAMAEKNIPGIRYLDQGSRGTGKGTYNYVVNNPDIVSIIKKYGIVAAAPLLAALARQDQQQ